MTRAERAAWFAEKNRRRQQSRSGKSLRDELAARAMRRACHGAFGHLQGSAFDSHAFGTSVRPAAKS